MERIDFSKTVIKGGFWKQKQETAHAREPSPIDISESK